MATPPLPPVLRASLAEALDGFVAADTVADRIDGFVGLVEWIRAGGDPASDPFARGVNRLTALIDTVEADPALREPFRLGD